MSEGQIVTRSTPSLRNQTANALSHSKFVTCLPRCEDYNAIEYAREELAALQKTRSQGKFRHERTHSSTRSRPATLLDGQTQLTAMFGAPERLSKDPRPAPAPVVTPPGSRSKRKWAPANAIPPLSLPPLAKTPKKAVPPGWMRYGLAPALRRCDECGDDVVGPCAAS